MFDKPSFVGSLAGFASGHIRKGIVVILLLTLALCFGECRMLTVYGCSFEMWFVLVSGVGEDNFTEKFLLANFQKHSRK